MSAADVAEALGGKRSGKSWVACCPAHDDSTPSLSVSDCEGRVLVKCHAGCDQQAVIDALSARGIELRQPTERVSVAAFAHKKRLDLRFLRECNVRDVLLNGGAAAIAFDYLSANGRVTGTKLRHGLNGADRGFSWAPKPRPSLYGLWRVADMHALDQRLVIVEGESDALTLWAAGFSALGLPGASNWREEWAGELPEGAQVYVVIEPDSGGKAVLKWLGRSKLAATARLIRMPAERKDPSALYLADPEHFREKFEALIAAAEPFQSDAEAPAGADQFAHLRASIIADLAMGPDAIDDAQPPRWVVEKRIPVAGANLAGSGGAGKTTAILNEYVHIVGGGKLYGCDVIQQGPAVLVTAEDGAEYPRYILQRVLADGVALGSLPERAAQRAKSEIRIVGWSRPKFGPISLVDREGNVTRAPGFDVLLELLAPLNPAAVTLDPAALFSPGERFGNDGESFLAAMMHEAALALGCQFQVLDHVSQNVALSGLVHQHAARGGTAKTDNARLARQLVKFKAEEAAGSFQPLSIAPEEIAAGRILQLHWTKLNYGPLPPLAWLRRHGHWIENLHAPGREVIDAARRLRAQKVCSEDDALVLASLKQLVAAGLRMSRNELDDVTVLEPDGDKLPRARMRQALHRLISAGIVLEEPLPRAEVRGQRKHFLALRSAL